jgi:DNA polymerase-3 subunit epsilon
MKEIVLDTETTGISIKEGHRIVEIGCIELDNLIPTKNKFHSYLNPEKKVSERLSKFTDIQMIFWLHKKNLLKLLNNF